jgi:hypothetical protein
MLNKYFGMMNEENLLAYNMSYYSTGVVKII